MSKKTWVGAVVGVVILIGILWFASQKFGPPQQQHGTPRKEWPKVRIGYMPIAAELPLFVAVEEGFFDRAGIRYELIRVPSSNEMGNSATADKIDILAGAALNVVFDIGHVAAKKHLLFVLNPYSSAPGHITDHLIVRKRLALKNIVDLRGKRIAGLPGSVKVLIFLILEKHGLPRGSYEYVELLPKDWEPSLEAGAIDAVVALEPNATQILKDGVGTSALPGFYAELMPDLPISGHWVAADYFKRADKSQLAAFLDAYDNAIVFCRERQAQARRHLLKYAAVREDILAGVNLNPWKRQSEIDPNEIQRFIDLLARNGALQGRALAQEYLLPSSKGKD